MIIINVYLDPILGRAEKYESVKRAGPGKPDAHC